jgi:MoxR-like ATPase
MFDSPEQTLSALSRVGYFTDQKTATTVYLAGQINKPILLEAPAGAGKTELAQSVARAAGADLLRLQCYQGINEEKAIGQFDKSLQELFVLLTAKTEGTYEWDQIRRDVTSRAFFLAGPLLMAIEKEKRCVLLIDEIDKVDYAFEALLLELLSAWTISIPKMGTVRATTVPFVFMTSNQERRLGDPLRRRSFYLIVEHPTAEREAAIVKSKTPTANAATHRHRWDSGLTNPSFFRDGGEAPFFDYPDEYLHRTEFVHASLRIPLWNGFYARDDDSSSSLQDAKKYRPRRLPLPCYAFLLGIAGIPQDAKSAC